MLARWLIAACLAQLRWAVVGQEDSIATLEMLPGLKASTLANQTEACDQVERQWCESEDDLADEFLPAVIQRCGYTWVKEAACQGAEAAEPDETTETSEEDSDSLFAFMEGNELMVLAACLLVVSVGCLPLALGFRTGWRRGRAISKERGRSMLANNTSARRGTFRKARSATATLGRSNSNLGRARNSRHMSRSASVGLVRGGSTASMSKGSYLNQGLSTSSLARQASRYASTKLSEAEVQNAAVASQILNSMCTVVAEASSVGQRGEALEALQMTLEQNQDTLPTEVALHLEGWVERQQNFAELRNTLHDAQENVELLLRTSQRTLTLRRASFRRDSRRAAMDDAVACWSAPDPISSSRADIASKTSSPSGIEACLPPALNEKARLLVQYGEEAHRLKLRLVNLPPLHYQQPGPLAVGSFIKDLQSFRTLQQGFLEHFPDDVDNFGLQDGDTTAFEVSLRSFQILVREDIAELASRFEASHPSQALRELPVASLWLWNCSEKLPGKALVCEDLLASARALSSLTDEVHDFEQSLETRSSGQEAPPALRIARVMYDAREVLRLLRSASSSAVAARPKGKEKEKEPGKERASAQANLDKEDEDGIEGPAAAAKRQLSARWSCLEAEIGDLKGRIDNEWQEFALKSSKKDSLWEALTMRAQPGDERARQATLATAVIHAARFEATLTQQFRLLWSRRSGLSRRPYHQNRNVRRLITAGQLAESRRTAAELGKDHSQQVSECQKALSEATLEEIDAWNQLIALWQHLDDMLILLYKEVDTDLSSTVEKGAPSSPASNSGREDQKDKTLHNSSAWIREFPAVEDTLTSHREQLRRCREVVQISATSCGQESVGKVQLWCSKLLQENRAGHVQSLANRSIDWSLPSSPPSRFQQQFSHVRKFLDVARRYFNPVGSNLPPQEVVRLGSMSLDAIHGITDDEVQNLSSNAFGALRKHGGESLAASSSSMSRKDFAKLVSEQGSGSSHGDRETDGWSLMASLVELLDAWPSEGGMNPALEQQVLYLIDVWRDQLRRARKITGHASLQKGDVKSKLNKDHTTPSVPGSPLSISGSAPTTSSTREIVGYVDALAEERAWLRCLFVELLTLLGDRSSRQGPTGLSSPSLVADLENWKAAALAYAPCGRSPLLQPLSSAGAQAILREQVEYLEEFCKKLATKLTKQSDSSGSSTSPAHWRLLDIDLAGVVQQVWIDVVAGGDGVGRSTPHTTPKGGNSQHLKDLKELSHLVSSFPLAGSLEDSGSALSSLLQQSSGGDGGRSEERRPSRLLLEQLRSSGTAVAAREPVSFLSLATPWDDNSSDEDDSPSRGKNLAHTTIVVDPSVEMKLDPGRSSTRLANHPSPTSASSTLAKPVSLLAGSEKPTSHSAMTSKVGRDSPGHRPDVAVEPLKDQEAASSNLFPGLRELEAASIVTPCHSDTDSLVNVSRYTSKQPPEEKPLGMARELLIRGVAGVGSAIVSQKQRPRGAHQTPGQGSKKPGLAEPGQKSPLAEGALQDAGEDLQQFLHEEQRQQEEEMNKILQEDREFLQKQLEFQEKPNDRLRTAGWSLAPWAEHEGFFEKAERGAGVGINELPGLSFDLPHMPSSVVEGMSPTSDSGLGHDFGALVAELTSPTSQVGRETSKASAAPVFGAQAPHQKLGGVGEGNGDGGAAAQASALHPSQNDPEALPAFGGAGGIPNSMPRRPVAAAPTRLAPLAGRGTALPMSGQLLMGATRNNEVNAEKGSHHRDKDKSKRSGLS